MSSVDSDLQTTHICIESEYTFVGTRYCLRNSKAIETRAFLADRHKMPLNPDKVLSDPVGI